MLKTVATLLLDELAMFEFGVVCEVFGVDRTEEGVPAIDFRVCGSRAGVPLTATIGAQVVPPFGLDGLLGADLVAVPAAATRADYPLEVLDALRQAHERGAVVLSVCSGAFVLGAAGLLDGRRCTTHWLHVDELRQRFPLAEVDPDVLFVDDGDLITSAGTAAGIDACLHLVRRELGSAVTNTIARRMVVPPQREGGQRQFFERPVPQCRADGLGTVLTWMLEHLDQPHTVASLAARAHTSSRSFARHFAAGPERPPCSGSPRSACCMPNGSSKTPTSTSTPSPRGAVSPVAHCCATISAAPSASPPAGTARASAPRSEHRRHTRTARRGRRIAVVATSTASTTHRHMEVAVPLAPEQNPDFADYAHPERLVSTDWVAEHLNEPGLKIVESDEDVLLYDSGHLRGSVKVDWHTELNDPVTRDYVDGEGFATLMSAKGISRDDTVVIYGDKSNWWAAYALWVFTLFGHPDVRLMNGGRNLWQVEDRELTRDKPDITPSDYPAVQRSDEAIRAFKDDVLTHLGENPLIDVRSVPEYTGERTHMPDYPEEGALRGGHIPTAASVPWAKAAADDGRFMTRPELETVYQDEAGLTPGDDVIAYCRIGERSSHTWFVLTHLLGYEHVRNYDGSWTEWGNAVRVPIVKGEQPGEVPRR